MSTVTYMQAAGEMVVGLDKSATRWRPAASARSTSQPLRAVRVFSCSPKGDRADLGREGVSGRDPRVSSGPPR